MNLRKGAMLKFSALLVLAHSLLACREPSSLASTETTNGTVNGIAVYETGKPAGGALVRIRPIGYLANMAGASGDSMYSRWEAKTDATGKYRLENLAFGRYSIEINDGNRHASRTVFQVGPDTPSLALGKELLRKTGILRATLKVPARTPGSAAYARIYGMERIAVADSSGQFVLQDIPGGTFDLRFDTGSPGPDSLDVLAVSLPAGRDSSLGAIQMPVRDCPDLNCDTLALRTLLDINGKTTIGVDSIIRIDSTAQRVTELNLSNMGLDTLIEEVGALTRLRVLRAPGNRFKSLPKSLSRLQGLEILYLENNQIRELPPDIGIMASLKEIHLNTNRLAALPAGMGRLKNLKYLSVARTGLKALPDDLAGCQALEFLELTSDSLVSLPGNIGSLGSLKQLYLNDNQLTSLPDGVVNLTGLTTLSLDSNSICQPPSVPVEAWIRQYSQDGANWKQGQRCP